MRRLLRDNGLSIAMFGLFFVFVSAQSVMGLLDHNSTQEEHRQPPVGYVQLYCARPVESYNHWLRNAFLIIPQIAELYKLPSWIAKEVEGEIKFVRHSTIARPRSRRRRLPTTL